MTSYRVSSVVDTKEKQLHGNSGDNDIENGDGEGKKILTFEELPKFLQFGIKYSFHASKCVKYVAISSWSAFMIIISFLVFGLGIFDNIYIGFVFFPLCAQCGFAFFGNASDCFNYTQNNSLIFDIIGSNERIAKKISKYYQYLTIFFVYICVVLITLISAFILPAYCARAGIEGVTAFVLILLGALADVFWLISFNLGVGLDIIVLIFYKDYRIKCLQSYLDEVRETLLELAKKDGDNVEVDLLGNLRQGQINIEKMAKKYNTAYSIYYGNQIITYLIWTFVPLASILLIRTNLFAVIFCCVLGICFLPFVFLTLRLCALVNVEWNKAIKTKLKCWDLAPIIKKTFGSVNEFESYLNAHEAACSTVFGFRITLDLLQKITGIVGSAFSLFMYFIVRNEMQKAL